MSSYEEYYLKKVGAANEKTGWDNRRFDQVREAIEEERRFIENPFEAEEGVVECKYCGSLKTYSYQKQVRSADEGFSTFTLCLDCKKQSREN